MNIHKQKISYPVSLPEAKSQVKEETEDNDINITRLIKVATQYAENIVGMDLAYTKNTLTSADFIGNYITINQGNYKSLDYITGDDASIGYERVIEYPHKFIIELENSITVDELVVVWYGGYTEDDEDTDNYEAVRNYILVKIDSLVGPERSEYTLGSINKLNHAENLLNGLKGYY
jgi:hypothetical protein